MSNTYTIAETKFCPPVCWSRFPSGVLQNSLTSFTLGLSSLFNEEFVELQTWEASIGTFFNFFCNCCMNFFKLPNQLLKNENFIFIFLLVHYCTNPTFSRAIDERLGLLNNHKFFSQFRLGLPKGSETLLSTLRPAAIELRFILNEGS